MGRSIVSASLALLALVAAGCGNFAPPSGQLICNPNGQACPDGYYCAADNHCFKNGDTGGADLSATISDFAVAGKDAAANRADLATASDMSGIETADLSMAEGDMSQSENSDLAMSMVDMTGRDLSHTDLADMSIVDLAVADMTCVSNGVACKGKACGMAVDNCGVPVVCGVCPLYANGSATCTANQCVDACNTDYADCDGNAANGCEVNLKTDVANCGACRSACSAVNGVAACANGACSIACNTGYGDCDGNVANGCETNTDTSLGNCGGCQMACASTCVAGVCSKPCPVGYANCDNNPNTGVNGCEANIGDDIANCGACARVCSGANISTPTCTMSVCNGMCNSGYADCDNNKQTNGCETNVNTGANNCGGCGLACSNNNITIPTCAGGACTGSCNTGYADCDGNKQGNGCETNVNGDPKNCGGCGTVCSGANIAVPTCTNGSCSGMCNAGYADCDGSKLADGCETNIEIDAKNCGACGNVCSLANATSSCSAGACKITACAAGWTDCDGVAANGCETPTSIDPKNCGGCGTVCSNKNIATPTCAAGVCSGTCANGYADCDGNKQTNGCEASLLTDPDNCGACKTECSANNIATPTCAGGSCTGACNAGYADCDGNKQTDGCEVNTQTDAKNCGTCGDVCSLPNASSACGAGACKIASCGSGYADCDGNAANGCESMPATDPKNCGACGTACSTNNVTAACGNGSCDGACATGYADCNNNKQADGCETSTSANLNDCGSCGNVCPARANATSTCAGGACGYTCTAGWGDCNGLAADGCETNLNTDVNNCGACKTVCNKGIAPATNSCSGGSCVCTPDPSPCKTAGNPGCGTAPNGCGGTAICGLCAVGKVCCYPGCYAECP